MRILRVIPTLDATRGGPSAAARATSRALARAGADVVQATTVAPGSTPDDDGAPRVVDRVVYRLFRRTLPGGFHYSRSLGAFLRESTRDFDVVHVEALFQYPTVPACSAARRALVPYVLAPLGSLNAWSIRHRAWKKKPYYWLVERHNLAHASAIHANSDAEVEALAAAGFADKVRMIPLGVDLPSPAGTLANGGRPLQVLFLSRLHPVKGLPLLLEAIAAVRAAGIGIALTVAGSGDAAYERTLQEHVRRHALGDAVRFVGHVDGVAKDALFRSAHVFALTSYQESFGLAVAEAMAYGLPVLITDRVGIERDVREMGAGHVVPPAVAPIAAALTELARSAERRAEMGAKGARLVADRYSWDRTARELLRLYEEIVRARRGLAAPLAALA